jgi:hypothetical protein
MQKSVGASGSSERRKIKSWRDTGLVFYINDSRKHKYLSLCHESLVYLYLNTTISIVDFQESISVPQQVYVATISG